MLVQDSDLEALAIEQVPTAKVAPVGTPDSSAVLAAEASEAVRVVEELDSQEIVADAIPAEAAAPSQEPIEQMSNDSLFGADDGMDVSDLIEQTPEEISQMDLIGPGDDDPELPGDANLSRFGPTLDKPESSELEAIDIDEKDAASSVANQLGIEAEATLESSGSLEPLQDDSVNAMQVDDLDGGFMDAEEAQPAEAAQSVEAQSVEAQSMEAQPAESAEAVEAQFEGDLEALDAEQDLFEGLVTVDQPSAAAMVAIDDDEDLPLAEEAPSSNLVDAVELGAEEAPEIAPGPAQAAESVDADELESALQALEPQAVFDRLIRPFRLHTTVEALPIDAAEVPLG